MGNKQKEGVQKAAKSCVVFKFELGHPDKIGTLSLSFLYIPIKSGTPCISSIFEHPTVLLYEKTFRTAFVHRISLNDLGGFNAINSEN